MNFGRKLLPWVTATAATPRSGLSCYALAAAVIFVIFTISSQLSRESVALFTVIHVFSVFVIAAFSGRGPGYFAGVLAALSVDYNYIRPSTETYGSPAAITFFVLTLVLINATLFIVGLLQRAAKDALDSKRIADAAVKSREDALAVIAHDLRQPIAMLLLQNQVCLKGLEDNRDVDLEGKLRRGVSTLKRMDQLIQDLLESSKVDSETLSLSTEPVDLCSLTNSIVNEYLHQASQKAIRFEIRIPETRLPPINGDKNRLMRVISNLVTNSLKFTPDGGSIEIALDMPDPGHEQFRITNSGPEIPAEQVPNLFKRNWQDRHTAHLGSGLGLYICQGIIKAHSGSIWYEPRPDAGPSFCFRLPVA